ncbi:hypothetical protein [Acidicapsa ligni]|uniref:hypothetical protein n=1 Tax=Acidicapsa ligni TaxID=542300 RepID=UPI0021DFB74E|nr:hypothetical protein [Acidicapsa ligni]
MPDTTLPVGYPKINSRTTLDQLLLKVSQIPPPEPPDLTGAATDPTTGNPAVTQCCNAYGNALEKAATSGELKFDAVQQAEKAYRRALPALSGAENIRDFLACIAHGMLIGAIRIEDGTRLTYVAQVAYNARPIEPKIRRNLLQELKTASNEETPT